MEIPHVFDIYRAYFTQQQDKAVNELVQHATCNSLAQPPTGSEPGRRNTIASQKELLTELLSGATESVACVF